MLWLKGRRPPEPPDWRARVCDAENRLRAALSRRQKPIEKHEEDELFPDLWKHAKSAYFNAQFWKCGYCEERVTSDLSAGDIEHFYPKSKVEELVKQGQEMPGQAKIISGSREVGAAWLGYWWLAYEWCNYLLSCSNCNTRWKLCAFPIEGGRLRAPTQKGWRVEKPLLLDPYGDENPAKHLAFTEFGQIAPRAKSPRGEATITTCDLSRETLRQNRQQTASQVQRWVNQILAVDSLPPGIERTRALAVAREAVHNIRHNGGDAMNFCGMVRILACDGLGVERWDDLDEAILPDP